MVSKHPRTCRIFGILEAIVVLSSLLPTARSSSKQTSTGSGKTLWIQNHTSQVQSIASRTVSSSTGAVPIVLTGSTFVSDDDVAAVNPLTGAALWSSQYSNEWMYGVALSPTFTDALDDDDGWPGNASSPSSPAPPPSSLSSLPEPRRTNRESRARVFRTGAAAFGCPFAADPSKPSNPCAIAYWQDVSVVNAAPTVTVPVAGSVLAPGGGAPTVAFTAGGRAVIVMYTKLGNNAGGAPLVYLHVVDVHDSSLTATLLIGTGDGHAIVLDRAPATRHDVQVTTGLVSRPDPSNPNGVAHYALTITTSSDGSKVPVIAVADKAAIGCGGKADCRILTTSADLRHVVVSANPTSGGSGSICPVQQNNPFRWGFAVMKLSGDGVYLPSWNYCGDSPTDVATALRSVSIVESARRASVVITTSHIVAGTTAADGITACSYALDDDGDFSSGGGGGGNVTTWCTHEVPIQPPSPNVLEPVIVAELGGFMAFGVPGLGIYALDTTSTATATATTTATANVIVDDGVGTVSGKGNTTIANAFSESTSTPMLSPVYTRGGAGDCCGPTAVTVVGNATSKVVVASIPRGSFDGKWCQCEHSTLVGVAVLP